MKPFRDAVFRQTHNKYGPICGLVDNRSAAIDGAGGDLMGI